MAIVYYLTHPEVAVDTRVPVTEWRLSDVGRRRAATAAEAGWCATIMRIVSSSEQKAIDTARPFADRRGLDVEIRPAMHENDRSSTGFLVPAEFEMAADVFFAKPEDSMCGWERAMDAQARIVAEMDAVLSSPVDGDLLVVGHGAVGTLFLTHLLGVPITRSLDQPAGGGNVFAFDAATTVLRHRWHRLEQMDEA